jgi:hypothetical protein
MYPFRGSKGYERGHSVSVRWHTPEQGTRRDAGAHHADGPSWSLWSPSGRGLGWWRTAAGAPPRRSTPAAGYASGVVVGRLRRVGFLLAATRPAEDAYAVAPTRRADASGISWSRVTVAVRGMRRRCCGSACASRRRRRGVGAVAGVEGLPSDPPCYARTAGAAPCWGRLSHPRARGVTQDGCRPICAHLLLFPRATRLLHAAFGCLSGRAPARCSSQVRTADS